MALFFLSYGEGTTLRKWWCAFFGGTFDSRVDRCYAHRTPFQRHLDFFDARQTGVIKVSDTYRLFKHAKLDVHMAIPWIGKVYWIPALLVHLFLARQTWGLPFALTINPDGAHRITGNPHLGIFDDQHALNRARLDCAFTTYDRDMDDALDDGDLTTAQRALVRSAPGRWRQFLATQTTRAELPTLMSVAGEQRGDRRVLSRDVMATFYEGKLLWEQIGKEPPVCHATAINRAGGA